MIQLERVSAQELSDTIGTIYDCALDPQQWPAAIRRISDLCESPSGGMCVHDLKNVHQVQLFEIGYSQTFLQTLMQHYEGSPLALAAAVREVGEVATLEMDCPDEELFESRFYREALAPFGILDFISLIGLRSGSRVASVHAGRTDKAPRYAKREIALFRLLSPHICRTLTISDALDIRTLRSEMLEATLDTLAAAVYLVARDGRVVYLNVAAERQIATGNVLRVVGDRLLPTDLETRAALAKAIEEVAREKTPGGHSLAIADPGGAGCVATLLPLDDGQRRSILAPFAAAVAIFVQQPSQLTLIPGEAFAKLYGLTAGELRVLQTLAQGLTAREAAEMLGIGEPTVRTHVQRMLSKTGTTRQIELLQLLHSVTPPAGAA